MIAISVARAERSGRGPGRIYTATYRATDPSANYTDSVAIVEVPHDQRNKDAKADYKAAKAAYKQAKADGVGWPEIKKLKKRL